MKHVLHVVERVGHWVLCSYPDLLTSMQGSDADDAHEPANDPTPAGSDLPVYWPFGI